MNKRVIVDTTGSTIINRAIALNLQSLDKTLPIPPKRMIMARSPNGTFTGTVPLTWGLDTDHMVPMLLDGEALTLSIDNPETVDYVNGYIGCDLSAITSTDLIVEINI